MLVARIDAAVGSSTPDVAYATWRPAHVAAVAHDDQLPAAAGTLEHPMQRSHRRGRWGARRDRRTGRERVRCAVAATLRDRCSTLIEVDEVVVTMTTVLGAGPALFDRGPSARAFRLDEVRRFAPNSVRLLVAS